MKPYQADPYFEYLLTRQAMQAKALAHAIGWSTSTLHGHLVRLRKERKIYVARWEKIDSAVIAYWAWGKQRSAPRPRAIPESVKKAAFLKRLKADPDRYDRKLKRDQIRHVIDKARVRPATWFSVLGVM